MSELESPIAVCPFCGVLHPLMLVPTGNPRVILVSLWNRQSEAYERAPFSPEAVESLIVALRLAAESKP